MSEPCDWPISYSGCGTPPAWDADQQALAEQMAADLLWNWTGHQFGACPVKIRPCKVECTDGGETFWGRGPFSPGYATDHSKGGWYGPALLHGQWFNISCGVCGDGCSCDNPSTLKLPGPVQMIIKITIDGKPVPQAAFRVDNFSLLVRTDGGSWPSCQAMGLDVDKPGTFEISYVQGYPVPIGGQVAAGVLAVELFKAVCNDKSCALPQRVQTVTRQGVTVTVLDTFDDVVKGRTGIWLVDSWVSSIVNPPRASQVYSVDIARPRSRRQTWPSTP